MVTSIRRSLLSGRNIAIITTRQHPFPISCCPNLLTKISLELCLREFPSTTDSAASFKRSQENLKFEFRPEILSPPLRSLFYSFNSIPFVGFIENLTGIRGLIPDRISPAPDFTR